VVGDTCSVKILRVVWSSVVGAFLGLVRTRARRLRPLDVSPFGTALDEAPDLASLVSASSVADLQAAMDRGELTSEALAAHLLRRIARLDDDLCTIIELDPTALDQARASDDRRRAGSLHGPLDGIPLTLKDNIATVGPMRTTAGAVVLADHVADADAPVVERLRAGGAVILGKANLSELAGAVCRTPGVSAVGGATRNPFGSSFSPGGSSSGSAASVAAGLCVVSVGTETSGSLLAPAAFNGVVGMKPSRGRVPTEGIVHLISSQDSAGPVARTVADAAVLFAVLAGGPASPPLDGDSLRGVAVGVLEDAIRTQRTPFEDTSDAEAILTRILDGLRTAGAEPVPATLGDADAEAVKAFEAAFGKFLMGGLAWDTVPYLAAMGAPTATVARLLSFNTRHPRRRMPKGQLIVNMATLTAPDEAGYRAAAPDLVRDATSILDAAFESAGTDVLASVTNLHSPFYATAGYPAITVPIGLRANGMPTGVVLIGRPGTDETLLSRAFAFEQATTLRVPPPER
jgi:amidase